MIHGEFVLLLNKVHLNINVGMNVIIHRHGNIVIEPVRLNLDQRKIVKWMLVH